MWQLRSNLTACLASDRLILLDEARDRYFALPETQMREALAWLSAADGSPAPSSLSRLLGERLSNTGYVRLSLPEPSTVEPAAGDVGRGAIISTNATVAQTWLLLRLQRLGPILVRRRRSRSRRAQLGDEELLMRARAFQAARRWCPIPRNCLLDSLSFDRWLGSPGDVRIVFGVIARPFEAHCWVQTDCHVLNDSYDRVSRFEPILSL